MLAVVGFSVNRCPGVAQGGFLLHGFFNADNEIRAGLDIPRRLWYRWTNTDVGGWER